MRRVQLITNIPTPYRIPLLNALARQLKSYDLHLNVLFGKLGYARRQWTVDMDACEFDYDVLASRTFEMKGSFEKTLFTYGGLFSYLDANAPDVVVVPGFSMATLQVWAYSYLRSLPYVIWTGSVEQTWDVQAHERTARSASRTLLRKVLVRRAAGCVAYGSKARSYLLRLGAQPDTVRIGINTVDTEFFAAETRRLRTETNLPRERQRLLSVGYLTARKGTVNMLEAVKRVARERSDFVVDIVGDGDDRSRLEAFVKENGLSDYVRFHGYRQKEELPAFLARSAGLLYATNYDIWGLVLVEAMAAGLPVIASIHAGATHDLIQEGTTGLAVDYSDPDQVASKIHFILDHPEQAREIGENACGFIREHATIETSAAGFVDVILKVIGQDVLAHQPV